MKAQPKPLPFCNLCSHPFPHTASLVFHRIARRSAWAQNSSFSKRTGLACRRGLAAPLPLRDALVHPTPCSYPNSCIFCMNCAISALSVVIWAPHCCSLSVFLQPRVCLVSKGAAVCTCSRSCDEEQRGTSGRAASLARSTHVIVGCAVAREAGGAFCFRARAWPSALWAA